MIDDLVNASLEEVVEAFRKTERQRRDNEDDWRERAVPISYRSTIKGLVVATENICRDLQIGKQLLQRCLSHHIDAYLSSIPQLKEIGKLHRELYQLIDKHDLPEMQKRIDSADQFALVNEVSVPKTSYGTIARCRVDFKELALSAGITLEKLFAIGLAWSMTTSQSLPPDGIVQHLLAEVHNLELYLKERADILELHLGHIAERVKLRQNDKA